VDAWLRGDPYRVSAATDVLLVRARQPADRAVFDRAGHRLHRLEIAVARCRETGFDDVDAHALELACNAQLVVLGH